jgi:predicted CoA-binding protein
MYSQYLVDDDAGLAEIVKGARRVAVLGAKGDDEPSDMAFVVPDWLRRHGVEVLPVPAGAEAPAEMFGGPAYRKLADVPGPVDVVDVFRRSKDVERYVEELKALRPRCVWMQLGIRNDKAAEALARAGIRVVQDRCLMAEFRKHVLGK